VLPRCASSAAEHVIEQSLTRALPLKLDAQAVALNLDCVEAGLDTLELDLKLATLGAECGGSLLKLRHFLVELLKFHWGCLFDVLSIGHGKGDETPHCASLPIDHVCYVAELVLLIGDLTGMIISLDTYVTCLAPSLGKQAQFVDDPNGVEVAHGFP